MLGFSRRAAGGIIFFYTNLFPFDIPPLQDHFLHQVGLWRQNVNPKNALLPNYPLFANPYVDIFVLILLLLSYIDFTPTFLPWRPFYYVDGAHFLSGKDIQVALFFKKYLYCKIHILYTILSKNHIYTYSSGKKGSSVQIRISNVQQRSL